MATLVWVGNAAARQQVSTLTPANVEIGDVFTATINGKSISFTATAATVANVTAGLTAAWNASTIAEFAEITASDSTTHVTLTSDSDEGEPFTVTTSVSNAGAFTVTVATVRAGSAGVNQKQTITLVGGPTSGTFTVTHAGNTTAGIAFDASAATFETAFEGLASVGAGNGTTTRSGAGTAASPYVYTVEFTGTLAGTTQPLITASGASLDGAQTITHATTTQGSPGVNEVQQFVFTGTGTLSLAVTHPTYGTFNVSLSTSDSAATIQSAFHAAIISGGPSSVTIGAYGGVIAVTEPTTGTFRVAFGGTFGNVNIATMTPTTYTGTGSATVSVVTEGSSTAVNEVQTYSVNMAPTGGTYTLTFQGQTTAGIAYNAADSAVLSALEALSNIAAGDVTVSRSGSGTLSAPYVYTVTFLQAWAGTNVDQMTSSVSSLTGSGVATAITQAATAGVNEQQSVTLNGAPSGGTFTLTWDFGGGDETTGNIAYNASASTVQTAIEGLATPVPGDVIVTGPAGGPWLVEFDVNLGDSDVNLGEGDGALLTGGGTQTLTANTTTTATGPHHWDNASNWRNVSGAAGTVPVNGDTVIFRDCDVPCKYGFAQSAVTLAALIIEGSFEPSTLGIGLSNRHASGYEEYRALELAIGTTLLTINQISGAGAPLIRINLGSVQCTGTITGSGTSDDDDVPAVNIRGTHASNVFTVTGSADVGFAYFGGDTATIDVLRINPDAGGAGGGGAFGLVAAGGDGPRVRIGSGATLNEVFTRGGTLDTQSGMTALTMTGGNVIQRDGAPATLNCLEGTFDLRSTDSLTTTVIGNGGTVTCENDPRTKVLGTVSLHAGAALHDEHGTCLPLTFSLVQCSLAEVDVRCGTNVEHAITAL